MSHIYSMTGYAMHSRTIGKISLGLELRSVNSRYLDLMFRIGDELRFVEPLLRELIAARMTRGKIECRLSFQVGAGDATDINVNSDRVAQLLAAQSTVLAQIPTAAALTVSDILRWPGVLAEDAVQQETLSATIAQLASEVLEDLMMSRAREGAKLVEVLSEKLALMRQLVANAEPLLPEAVQDYRNKLATRLREAVATLDEERIAQEVSIFAQRVDVAEEMTRLRTHLDEVQRVLKQGGVVGKRLDFLMQELNREANTLASKAATIELTQIAVDLKLLIEQMREQVQNLE